MSYSSLYKVFKKSSSCIEEYKNGYGTGPMIWDYLRDRINLGSRWSSGYNDTALWALARDPKVPLHLRLCHVFTFDHAYCPFDKLGAMADALEMAHEDICKESSTWTHFKEIAGDMRKVKNQRYLRGVGLNCTSVANVWCDWNPSKGTPFDCYEYVTVLDAT